MVIVVYVDNEIEAELARGRLESEGITAQVRFSAKAGYPRYAAGYGGFGVRAPLSTYEVLVADADADDARRILATAAPHERRDGWRIWVFRAFAISVLLAFFWSAVLQVRLLF